LAASVIWPPIGNAIDAGGNWIVGAGAIGLLVYGIGNRALIPFGLHHILNALVWFQFGTFDGPDGVVRGDLHRYFAGDPEAGAFMAGWFFIMMFGLPAAAWAMARQADAEEREATKGIMHSAGFASFLTGVTEPIEFSFLFLAPLLYAAHAVLSGIALVVADLLSIRIGFGFSAGLIDYLALNAGLGSNRLLAIPVGLVFGVVYFFLFTWAIRQFDLPTPGRTPRSAAAPEAVADANP
ncbi:MAG TPA: PTS transporter subunit EIIC, partial [Egibacteraceae bacterium]|nr:PTS transporter subunit EIIC [Egibacteraceae bacterium]